jgi:hypothetical protein
MSGRRTVASMLAALALAGSALPTAAATLPTQVGQCSATTIAKIGTRLVDGTTNQPIPGSGSAVNFANGGYQVSYDTLPAITASRVGDPVTMCLISIPQNCPPGDARGKMYKTTNRRTHGSWTLPDSEHSCGGA